MTKYYTLNDEFGIFDLSEEVTKSHTNKELFLASSHTNLSKVILQQVSKQVS